jgi:hypothetical protein
MTTMTMTTSGRSTLQLTLDGAPSAADELLTAARRGLHQAARSTAPSERYRAAHVGALRAATAVLATRAQPCEARRGPRGVWGLLSQIAPELAEWAGYFALVGPAAMPGAAGALDGGTVEVTERLANDLVRDAEAFCTQVELLLHR